MGRAVAVFVSCIALTGIACMSGLTPAQRVQDAANDYTTAVRFGRMDIAADQVGKDAHGAFLRQHAAWGNTLRVLDSELLAMRLSDKDRAEVMVSVSWQRVDEAETRVTQIAQRWKNEGSGWRLESEERSRGDVGLLGEPVTMVPAPERPARFRTITIR
jgi:hypothetical protein